VPERVFVERIKHNHVFYFVPVSQAHEPEFHSFAGRPSLLLSWPLKKEKIPESTKQDLFSSALLMRTAYVLLTNQSVMLLWLQEKCIYGKVCAMIANSLGL